MGRKTQTRYERFAREYVIDLNATRAAIAAGYSEDSATAQASALLTNHNVKKLVAQLTAARLSKLDVTGERIIEELAKIGFSDIRKIFSADGQLKDVCDIDDETASAIAGIEYEKLFQHFGKGQAEHIGNVAKIKLADKLRALELLGKYRKLFTEKVEVTGDDALIAALSAGRKRLHGNSDKPKT